MRKFTDTKQKSYASGRRKKNARKATPVRIFKMKVKRGDTITVLTGKDKGKSGEVAKVFPKLNKVVVDGLNIAKRSLRKTGKNQSGRVVEIPMPIHASNVRVTKAKKSAK